LKNLKYKIFYACEKFDDRIEFEWRALEVYNSLDSEVIKDLFVLCSKEISQPKHIKYSVDEYRKLRVGTWEGLFQYVIFEIISLFKEKAIPDLIENIRNENTLIFAASIRVLCRMACQGIEVNFILDILDKYKDEPSVDKYRMIPQWLKSIRKHPIVDKIYDEHIRKDIKEESSLSDMVNIYRSISFWSKSNPLKARKYLPYLKKVINGKVNKYFEKELEIWSPLRIEEKFELIKINVAIDYLKMEKDKDILELLYSWLEKSEFEKNREKIQEWKDENDH